MFNHLALIDIPKLFNAEQKRTVLRLFPETKDAGSLPLLGAWIDSLENLKNVKKGWAITGYRNENSQHLLIRPNTLHLRKVQLISSLISTSLLPNLPSQSPLRYLLQDLALRRNSVKDKTSKEAPKDTKKDEDGQGDASKGAPKEDIDNIIPIPNFDQPDDDLYSIINLWTPDAPQSLLHALRAVPLLSSTVLKNTPPEGVSLCHLMCFL